MNRHLAAAGDLVEGLVLYGPFDSAEQAQAFEPDTENGGAVTAELLAPDEYADPVPAGVAIALITGTPVDGLFFYGPFASIAAAGEWAEVHQDGQDWWTAYLNPPD